MKLSTAAITSFILSSSTFHHSFAFTPSSTSIAFTTRKQQHQRQQQEHAVLTLKPNSIITDEATSISSTDISNGIRNRSSGINRQQDLADVIASEVLSLDTARNNVSQYLSQYMNQSGASIIYSKLVENGVTVVNGYSGGAVLPLLDQFHQDHSRHASNDNNNENKNNPLPIRWITNSNENSAGHIAEGYAKSSPRNPIDGKQPAGVVIATSGPGVTNLITPLQDAICDGVPMVVLCGQAATTAPQDAFQQAPAVALTTPCTKWSYQIKNAAELPFVMDYAFFIARHGRPGPVFIDLPKDLQNQVVDQEFIESFTNGIPIKDSVDGKNRDGIVRFAPRYYSKENGDSNNNNIVEEYLMHVGSPEKGILFSAPEEGSNSIRPFMDYDVADGDEATFQMDHHPSNVIFTDTAEDEVLKVGSSLTETVFDTIRQAKKPIIIAGQGCNDCPEDLKIFAESLNIPVTTTLHALGCFDERHPLALNMLGMHGHPTPNYMIQEADLIINIGSRFDDRITGRIGDFIPEAKAAAQKGRGGIIHVDIRASENAKQVKPTFFVHSTGKKFLQTMNQQMQKAKNDGIISPVINTTDDWLQRKSDLQKDFPVKVPYFPTKTISKTDEHGNTITSNFTPMSAQSVITEMNKQILNAGIMENCVFSTGVGIHQMVAAQMLTWTSPGQMVTSGSLGTMGVALGFVIGCKLANGHKVCIAIDGDGSFNMTFTELKTVAEQKIPVKIMILDNESQMMVEYWQRLFHEERYIAVTNTVNPKYGKLADAFGIKNLYVDHQEDLPNVMRQFLFDDPDEPVLMHVRIERTPCLPLVAPGKPLQEMILEDVLCEGLDACAAPS